MVTNLLPRFFLLLLIVSQLQSCSQNPTDPGPPYRARVLTINQSSSPRSPTDVPHFAWADVDLPHLESLTQLRGRYLEIIRGGNISLNLSGGSLAHFEGFSGGKAKDLSYKVDNGVVVPLDYNTLAMLSSYGLFESVIAHLNDLTALTPEELLRKAPGGKLRVFYEPSIVMHSSGITLATTPKLNAAYLTGLKQFVLFQRSAIERVPLATNLQVIAHEFGHALFEYTFYGDNVSSDGESSKRWEDDCALKGINEGFADFYSYSTTGSTNILQGSFSIPSIYEERQFANPPFNFSENIESCGGQFYCIGTLFAGALYQAQGQRLANSPPFMKEIIRSLKETQTHILELPLSFPDDKGPGFNSTCSTPLNTPGAETPKSLGIFLAGFINGFSPSDKQILCTIFSDKNWFGERGFAQEYRAYACF